MITSASNAQIKYIKQLLGSKKQRDRDGVFVTEGIKLFEEIKRDRSELLQKVYVSESFLAKEGEGMLTGLTCGCETVSDTVFESVSETVTPQGILCIVRKPEYSLDGYLEAGDRKILFLETLQDPGNLGTIFRTAEAAGADLLILSENCADVFNPKVVRSTMGSVLRVPFVECADSGKMLDLLKKAGITTYAAFLQASESLESTDFDKRSAILIGNEGNGLRAETALRCDHRIRIPMKGKTESLNAAVAAAVLMYRAFV